MNTLIGEQGALNEDLKKLNQGVELLRKTVTKHSQRLQTIGLISDKANRNLDHLLQNCLKTETYEAGKEVTESALKGLNLQFMQLQRNTREIEIYLDRYQPF